MCVCIHTRGRTFSWVGCSCVKFITNEQPVLAISVIKNVIEELKKKINFFALSWALGLLMNQVFVGTDMFHKTLLCHNITGHDR